MAQLYTVEEARHDSAPLQQDRLGRKRDTHPPSRHDHKVHAFIRLCLHDFKRRHGVEATEKLRQQDEDRALSRRRNRRIRQAATLHSIARSRSAACLVRRSIAAIFSSRPIASKLGA